MQSPEPSTPTRAKVIRRRYLVDRVFQLKYMVMLALLGAGISAVFGAMMYLSHSQSQRALVELMERAPGRGLVDISTIRAEMARFDATFLWLVVGTTALMAVALLLFGVLLTHRIAGPVYVMTLYLSALARGQFPVTRPLRKGDELKDFFETLHSAVEGLRKKESDEAQNLSNALNKLGSGDATAATDALRILKELRDRKNAALGKAGSAKAN